MSNTNRTGNLSIDSDNIFPIIKKWLYSDHDIFIRELVSNGCDAITKLKKLEIMGEYTFPEDYKASIQVIVNPEEKTMKFIDTGLGMTADEVEEYITKIAFSGATAFLEKYKDKTNADEMIGHFGLGFYSAFMVADEVHIDTLSYRDGATAVHWECDGGTQYTIGDGSKTTVGTEITLYLNEESVEFAKGQLKGYFEEYIPVDFWQRLKLYLAYSSLYSILWAANCSNEEVEAMIKRKKMVYNDFTKSSFDSPCWVNN